MFVLKTSALLVLAILAMSGILGCSSNHTPTAPLPGADSPTPSDLVTAGETVEPPDTPLPTVEPPLPTSADSPDPVVVLMAEKVTSMDPYRMVTTHPDGSIAAHLWDTLTRLNDQLQVEPSVAESWQLRNNFTWEIKLRQGVSFHNGEALTAEAVRFSMERAQSMPNSLETFARDVGLKQVDVLDDYTLRLTTQEPVANLPYHLAFLEILPPVYYAETKASQLAVAPIGSGPYRLRDKWIPDQPLILEAVPEYWGGAPLLPRLIFQTVPSDESRLIALRRGEAALVTDLPPIGTDQWESSDSRLVGVESTRRMFIAIRAGESGPLADKRVRQALNYGLDVKQIIDQQLEGYGERYGSWVNPPTDNPDLIPWPYNPDLARDLLAQAGFREGFTTPLYTPIGVYPQTEAVARAIAQQLDKIGVTVEVKSFDWISYVRKLLAHKDTGLFLLELTSHGDGLEDTKNLSGDFAFNPADWENQSFESTLKRAAGTFNEDARLRLLNEAQTIAYNDTPWIWLWRSYDFYGISQELDWTPRRDGLVFLYKTIASVEGNK